MIADKPRIGVVGTGWWSTEHHLPSLAGYDGARLAAVADTDVDRARTASARFGIELAFSSAEELYASGAIDGVVVATPHTTHHPLARAALDHGLHVFVEKPLATTGSDAWDLVAVARARGLHLMAGYTYQFTSTAARLADRVKDGLLGPLIAVAAIYTSSVQAYYRGEWKPGMTVGPQPQTYADPSAGGGQGHTQVTHALGMLLAITGAHPIEAHAYMHNAGLAVDLADSISFRLDSGGVGSVASSGSITGDQPDSQVIHYLGTDGVAVQNLNDATVTLASKNGPREVLSLGHDEESYPTQAPVRRFADVIAGHATNPAPGEPAARAAAVLEAAYRSDASQGPVAVWSPESGG